MCYNVRDQELDSTILMGSFLLSIFYDSMVNGKKKESRKQKQNPEKDTTNQPNKTPPKNLLSWYFSNQHGHEQLNTLANTSEGRTLLVFLYHATLTLLTLASRYPNNPGPICDPFTRWIFTFISLFISWYTPPIWSSFYVDITKFCLRLSLKIEFSSKNLFKNANIKRNE